MATQRRRQAGFTLIELLVVVLIIGILAAIAVPQYFKVVEKGKFAESMQWLNGLKGAQERYLAKNGTYYSGTITSTSFDVNLGVMTKFNPSAVTATNVPDWTIQLTRRTPPTPAVYGAYVVTYTAPPGSINCTGGATGACMQDLAPN